MLAMPLLELVHFAMEQKMLRTIKQRAEAASAPARSRVS
jgi:hypothetical protein